MIKELIVIAIILIAALGFLPHTGIFLSMVGVLAMMLSPVAVLVILLVPSFRSRFLSA